MPLGSSSGRTRIVKQLFRDFDAMAACLQIGDIEIFRLGGGDFAGGVLIADLGPLTVCWITYSAPVIVRSKVDRDARLFLVALDSEAGGIVLNGHALDDDRLVVYRPGATQHGRATPPATGVTILAVMTRSMDLERVSTSVTGKRFFSGPGLCTLVHPTPVAMEAARALARHDRHLLDDGAFDLGAESLGAMAEDLLTALVTAVASDGGREEGHEWSGDFSALLVGRAEKFLRGNAGERIRLDQLCNAADASERQLQRAFNVVYGVSPTHYLKLLRLHLARRALSDDPAAGTSVADVAAHAGFQDFGRFSVAYRGLFGEMPSQTLARSRAS